MFFAAHRPADYAFIVKGHLLRIVEAKKVTLGPQNVLVQAERYSKGASGGEFDFRRYRVPFLYSTNGEIRWFHDIRDPLNRSRGAIGTFRIQILPGAHYDPVSNFSNSSSLSTGTPSDWALLSLLPAFSPATR